MTCKWILHKAKIVTQNVSEGPRFTARLCGLCSLAHALHLRLREVVNTAEVTTPDAKSWSAWDQKPLKTPFVGDVSYV